MKKLILPLILTALLCGCSSADKAPSVAEDKYTEITGIIESAENGIITVNYSGKTKEIEGECSPGDIGRDIRITYKNGIADNFEIYGVPYMTEAKAILENMTLEEKAGQMFFVRCPEAGKELPITKYAVGGYILFARDFENKTPAEVTEEIARYQAVSKIPMLIGVDEEGGSVVRASKYSAFRSEPFKSPSALYAEGGFDRIKADTDEKSAFLKNLGINVNLAPVCDVSLSADDYIHDRTLGLSAEETAEYVKTVVSAMKENKIGSVLKHFPGYGNNVNTHTGIAIDERSYDTFVNSDFLPFKAGIENGADAVLVSHNIVNCMDDRYPASLSLKVHNILRNDLDFSGVIITDALDMDAITDYTDSGNAAVLAVKVGNDMIICTDYETQINAVIEAVKSGDIDESLISEAVLKILMWKISLGII